MKPRLILVGGFLGAGKTTVIVRLVKWLNKKGLNVAVITNDQAPELVDSDLLRMTKATVREISGGCFCCRSDEFAGIIAKLHRDFRPDVIIGEPVGSCTDIRATVIKPMMSIYKVDVTIAPFSVLVDPFTIERIWGKGPSQTFAREIDYIIAKQMEEADCLVLNKVDLLPAKRVAKLGSIVNHHYPNTDLRSISASTGRSCVPWFNWLLENASSEKASVDVDYSRYADGEGLLAWLNGTVLVEGRGKARFDPSRIMSRFADSIQRNVAEKGSHIAHFKATLSRWATNENEQKLSKINCAAQIGGRTAPMTLKVYHRSRLTSGLLRVNLRAQGNPSALRQALSSAVSELSSLADLTPQAVNAFAPSPPVPVHRMR